MFAFQNMDIPQLDDSKNFCLSYSLASGTRRPQCGFRISGSHSFIYNPAYQIFSAHIKQYKKYNQDC
jgi:hypothetical protein